MAFMVDTAAGLWEYPVEAGNRISRTWQREAEPMYYSIAKGRNAQIAEAINSLTTAIYMQQRHPDQAALWLDAENEARERLIALRIPVATYTTHNAA